MSSNKENIRVTPSYKDTSQKFLLEPEDLGQDAFYRQYFLAYQARIDLLYGRLLRQARKELGENVPFVEMSKVEFNKKCFIMGVTLKRMKQRPSVLKEFKTPNIRSEEDAETEEMSKYSILDSICSSDDCLKLGGPEQDLILSGNINKEHFVTGFVIGLYGVRDLSGNFSVEKIIFPELAPQIPRPLKIEETYVMFISGIGLETDLARNENTCLALSQVIDWLYGCSGSEEDIELARRVSRVVFAGDNMRTSSSDIDELQITKIGLKTNFEPTAIEQLDRILENFLHTVPIDVMPGPNDICAPMVPQQPILVRVFDRCYRYGIEMFNVVPNPYSFEIDGVRILGTSGQNLHDLLKFTRSRSKMELMRQFLDSSYLFPTCPDTIDGFPLANNDPLIVDEIPHVFFAGNQSDHESQMCEFENGARTLLMTIPIFSVKREAVLLNLKTLETKVFRFDQALTI